MVVCQKLLNKLSMNIQDSNELPSTIAANSGRKEEPQSEKEFPDETAARMRHLASSGTLQKPVINLLPDAKNKSGNERRLLEQRQIKARVTTVPNRTHMTSCPDELSFGKLSGSCKKTLNLETSEMQDELQVNCVTDKLWSLATTFTAMISSWHQELNAAELTCQITNSVVQNFIKRYILAQARHKISDLRQTVSDISCQIQKSTQTVILTKMLASGYTTMAADDVQLDLCATRRDFTLLRVRTPSPISSTTMSRTESIMTHHTVCKPTRPQGCSPVRYSHLALSYKTVRWSHGIHWLPPGHSQVLTSQLCLSVECSTFVCNAIEKEIRLTSNKCVKTWQVFIQSRTGRLYGRKLFLKNNLVDGRCHGGCNGRCNNQKSHKSEMTPVKLDDLYSEKSADEPIILKNTKNYRRDCEGRQAGSGGRERSEGAENNNSNQSNGRQSENGQPEGGNEDGDSGSGNEWDDENDKDSNNQSEENENIVTYSEDNESRGQTTPYVRHYIIGKDHLSEVLKKTAKPPDTTKLSGPGGGGGSGLADGSFGLFGTETEIERVNTDEEQKSVLGKSDVEYILSYQRLYGCAGFTYLSRILMVCMVQPMEDQFPVQAEEGRDPQVYVHPDQVDDQDEVAQEEDEANGLDNINAVQPRDGGDTPERE